MMDLRYPQFGAVSIKADCLEFLDHENIARR